MARSKHARELLDEEELVFFEDARELRHHGIRLDVRTSRGPAWDHVARCIAWARYIVRLWYLNGDECAGRCLDHELNRRPDAALEALSVAIRAIEADVRGNKALDDEARYEYGELLNEFPRIAVNDLRAILDDCREYVRRRRRHQKQMKRCRAMMRAARRTTEEEQAARDPPQVPRDRTSE